MPTAVVVAALSVVLLTGCGGADDSDPGRASTADAGPAAPASDAVFDPDEWLLELDDDEQPGYGVSVCHTPAVSQYDAIPDDEDDYLSIVADGSTATLLSGGAVTPDGLLEVAQCMFALQLEADEAVDLTERIAEARGYEGTPGRAAVGDHAVEWRREGPVLGIRFTA